MQKQNKLLSLTRGGIFATLIFVATRFLSIPLPALGYIHLGDTLLFVAASLLPLPYAIGAGVLGAALSDLTSGFALYIPATILIKGLTACLFTAKTQKILCLRNCLAPLGALVLCAGGYFIWECILYDVTAAIASLPFNCLQIAVSAALYYPLAILLKKVVQ